MPEQSAKGEAPNNDSGTRRSVGRYSDCWQELEIVLQYLRGYGKEHPPTARLIMLANIGYEMDAYQISYETGASLYAVNENLAKLTEQGILVRRKLAAGRFKSTRYRLNLGFFTAKLGFTSYFETNLERSDDVLRVDEDAE